MGAELSDQKLLKDVHLCLTLPKAILTVPRVIIKSTLRRLHTKDATIAYNIVAANLLDSNHQRIRSTLHLNVPWVVLFSEQQEGYMQLVQSFGRPLSEFRILGHVWIFGLHAALSLSFLFFFGSHLTVTIVDVGLFVIVNRKSHLRNTEKRARADEQCD